MGPASNTTGVPGREGRSQTRLARVLLAVATSTLATSCGPVASEPVAAGRPTEDGTRSAATRSRDTESVPSGAYTPFVYEPRYPRALTSTQEEGCRDDIVRARQDPSADWVVVLSHRNSYRRQIIALRDDERIRVECRLPDVVLTHEVDAPIATDDHGILDQCGSVAGHDFTGWSVVTSMAAVQGVEAVLASTNGYTAYCSLQPATWDSGSDQVVAMPESSDRRIERRRKGEGFGFGLNGSSLSIKTAHTPIEGQLWWGSGTLYDGRGRLAEDAREIVVTFTDTGERFLVPVVRGKWAARIHRPAATAGLGQYRAAIRDQSGEVLAEFTN